MHKWADDTILLEDMKAGNRAAFDYCFEKYRMPLFYMAMSILQSEAEAKDAVQESFISLWERHLFQSISGSLKNYLFSSVKNRCLNKISTNNVRKKHLSKIMLPDDYQPPATGLEEKEQREAYQEMTHKLVRTIEAIAPKSAAIFKLAFLENKPHKEIARKLGISEQTSKNQLLRALKLARTYVKKHN